MIVFGYDVTPDTFNSVAVGLGALLVASATVGGHIWQARNAKKDREQAARIAGEVAAALKLSMAETLKVSSTAHEIKVSMDGRMDELLRVTGELRESLGIKKGVAMEQTRAAAEAEVAAGADRTADTIEQISRAVVERIGDAADAAALVVPATKVRES